MLGIVYLTTCLKNGKIYVGQTTNFEDKNYFGSGTKISDCIKRCGKSNFKRETLKECETQKQLDAWELIFIKKLNSTNENIGYNILKGTANNFSCENPAKIPSVREKMRRSAIKRVSNRIGKKHTKEAKEKMSKAREKYKTLDEEWKRKIRESSQGINLGAVRSDGMKQRLSSLKKGGKFINNGVKEKYLNKGEDKPKDWQYGRLKRTPKL